MKLSIDLGGMFDPPSTYLDRAEAVETAGFESLWFGDHIQPWFHTHGRAPFAYAWIPAALERTESIPTGVLVTPPLYRYHPLIIANAAATIDELYPGRFRLGVGTGELMNEHAFIQSWPSWDERAERTREAVEIIRTYWTEEEPFSYDGEHFSFEPIYPYEQPTTSLDVYVAATGPKSARLAASIGDHLVTIAALDDVETVVDTYRAHGGDGEIIFQCVGGYGDRDRLTDRIMQSFAPTLIPESFHMRNPWEIEELAAAVDPRTVQEAFLIAEDAAEVIRWVGEQEERGANHVVITDVSYEPEQFYETASQEILSSI